MKILITGGCGFIGRNAATRFLALGHRVTALDNLSRPGSEQSLADLQTINGFTFERADLRDREVVFEIVRRGRFDVLIHLGGQVAVTASMLNPRYDFDVNATGALNVLEAVRTHSPETIVLNASTNKVYGELVDLGKEEDATRYRLPNLASGVSEAQRLDFHSPYGCSKGAADQYMIDYARCFGLRTVSLRQSCIYGYWQFGVEDQGWVAWFIIAHHLNRPITIYGTGKQVRDVLFIDDLLDCYVAVIERIDQVSGTAFNIGGGPENTLSLLEFMQLLEQVSGRKVRHSYSGWRPGDQPVFISDVTRARELLGWSPKVGTADGIGRLYRWVSDNSHLFEHRPTAGSVAK